MKQGEKVKNEKKWGKHRNSKNNFLRTHFEFWGLRSAGVFHDFVWKTRHCSLQTRRDNQVVPIWQDASVVAFQNVASIDKDSTFTSRRLLGVVIVFASDGKGQWEQCVEKNKMKK